MTTVPAQYQGWVQQAAANTGLPESVVAAQINVESGFDPSATSPTNAEGIAQIEPSTWAGLGVSGSPYNPTDALAGYSKDMSQLLAEYHGNIRDALAAYNAGSANITAGYGYADKILAAAGLGGSASASTPGGPTVAASTASGSSGLLGGLTGALTATPALGGIAVIAGGLVLLFLGLWASGMSL